MNAFATGDHFRAGLYEVHLSVTDLDRAVDFYVNKLGFEFGFGSGKSTLASWIAGYTYAPLLDLDTVVWELGRIAVARSPEAAASALHAFCSANNRWIVEGCYASLIAASLRYSPLLIFLNPGEAQCLSNCRTRPWEAHKYASREEQDQRLDFWLSWVSEYYTRDGDKSLAAHRACFSAYTCRKVEVAVQP
jgi:adenylate kinase family enzyme